MIAYYDLSFEVYIFQNLNMKFWSHGKSHDQLFNIKKIDDLVVKRTQRSIPWVFNGAFYYLCLLGSGTVIILQTPQKIPREQ